MQSFSRSSVCRTLTVPVSSSTSLCMSSTITTSLPNTPVRVSNESINLKHLKYTLDTGYSYDWCDQQKWNKPTHFRILYWQKETTNLEGLFPILILKKIMGQTKIVIFKLSSHVQPVPIFYKQSHTQMTQVSLQR